MSIFNIAEIGINHNGDLEIAKKLIDIAISAGAGGELTDKIANIIIEEKNVNFQRAKELLNKLDNS